jgi:protein AroM
VPLVTDAARRLADGGAAAVVLACAGDFPAIPCAVPLVVPGRVVPAVVRAVAGGARVGVVTPNQAQQPFAEAKWRADGFDVAVTHASPVRHDELAAAAAAMREAGVALVVLDCMGHDDEYRAAFARLTGLPTLAAQRIVAELAGALV